MSLKDTLISQGKSRLMGSKGRTGTRPTNRRGKRAPGTTSSPLGSLSKYLKR
jgi:hypothetical protein